MYARMTTETGNIEFYPHEDENSATIIVYRDGYSDIEINIKTDEWALELGYLDEDNPQETIDLPN